ncbi:hypothetical protein P171DRAFT_521134 [Karstenula rhodostoma CBS 690.94]|uniref:Uncharacterized protein n=1 Tax=Karstenula rhodostoma CBS 690.94 TaxID=1392251 RepID=A0A9P4PLG0_9PLEO|nr:hypothetical protein P171DRAFT_521134 [Karstenula rhodostoma CBS 690.94]
MAYWMASGLPTLDYIANGDPASRECKTQEPFHPERTEESAHATQEEKPARPEWIKKPEAHHQTHASSVPLPEDLAEFQERGYMICQAEADHSRANGVQLMTPSQASDLGLRRRFHSLGSRSKDVTAGWDKDILRWAKVLVDSEKPDEHDSALTALWILVEPSTNFDVLLSVMAALASRNRDIGFAAPGYWWRYTHA